MLEHKLPIPRKFIFIIGMAHSGTSWVNEWLRKHPDIIGGSEIHLLSSMLKVEQWLIDREWSKKIKYTRIRKYCINVFETAAKNESSHILMHDCNLLACGKELDQVFPDAYYILIHRDGRRVAASLKQRLEEVPKHLYRRWTELSRLIIEKDLPKNLLTLRYDDLSKDSKLSKTITEFIGVDHHCDIDSENLVNCSFGKKMPEDCWKTILPEMNFDELHDSLKKLGYKI